MILFSSLRLNYSRLTEKHLEDFVAMDMDPKVMEFYTSRPHGKREDALKSFQRYMEYMAKFPKLGGFIAHSRESGEFVGLGVLIHLELNPAETRYEVGYRLPQKSWGQGFATEMCNRILEYGFNDLKLDEIYGTTNPSHVVSQKILLKCGLKEIGSSTNYGGSTVFKIIR